MNLWLKYKEQEKQLINVNVKSIGSTKENLSLDVLSKLILKGKKEMNGVMSKTLNLMMLLGLSVFLL